MSQNEWQNGLCSGVCGGDCGDCVSTMNFHIIA